MRKNGVVAGLLLLLPVCLVGEATPQGVDRGFFDMEPQGRPPVIDMEPKTEPWRHRHDSGRRDERRRNVRSDTRKYRREGASEGTADSDWPRTHASHNLPAPRLKETADLRQQPDPVVALPCAAENYSVKTMDAIDKIMASDTTLRPGDAYMASDGLRVYVGQSDEHQRFVPVGLARHLNARLKRRLKSVAATQPASAGGANATKPPSAPPQGERPREKRLVDGPNGRQIRYVGGSAK